MSRSFWKVPFIAEIFFSGMLKKSKIFSIWQRSSTIPSFYVNRKFKVHNGIWLLTLNIKTGMVGHKFGEFVFTKKMGRTIHIKKKKKGKKK